VICRNNLHRLAEVGVRADGRCAACAREDGLSPHALRRSFISWLIYEGEDPAYVMDQAGHTSPTMTLGVYARAVRTGRRSVRSRRRLAALAAGTAEELERAAMGTSVSNDVPTTADEAVA
jgi:integrase